MIVHCPCCQTRFSLDAVVQDSAARDLARLFSGYPMDLTRPLAAYLGLFRSRSRALSWERALRMADEVLAIEKDHALLGAALSETVNALYAKREHEPARPLTNHNYLRRVLEGLQGRQSSPPAQQREDPPAQPVTDGPIHPDVAPRLGKILPAMSPSSSRK